MAKKQTIGILGLGKIGEAIVSGIGRSPLAGQTEFIASTRSPESAAAAAKRLSIRCGTDNRAVVEAADLILLAVKPHQAAKVLEEVAPALRKNQLLISVCASVTTADLAAWTKGACTVIRAMPNTPSLVGEGMTVLAASAGAKPTDLKRAEEIFATVGRTAVLEEHLMDAATGLSGCGPAYMFLILEALSEAGVKTGISRAQSTLLAAQTMLGAAKMVLERGQHPAYMKDEVTTPAGCTIDGLMALEEGGIRVSLMRGVLAATRRSVKLREK